MARVPITKETSKGELKKWGGIVEWGKGSAQKKKRGHKVVGIYETLKKRKARRLRTENAKATVGPPVRNLRIAAFVM